MFNSALRCISPYFAWTLFVVFFSVANLRSGRYFVFFLSGHFKLSDDRKLQSSYQTFRVDFVHFEVIKKKIQLWVNYSATDSSEILWFFFFFFSNLKKKFFFLFLNVYLSLRSWIIFRLWKAIFKNSEKSKP
jgi:hypothetical protein